MRNVSLWVKDGRYSTSSWIALLFIVVIYGCTRMSEPSTEHAISWSIRLFADYHIFPVALSSVSEPRYHADTRLWCITHSSFLIALKLTVRIRSRTFRSQLFDRRGRNDQCHFHFIGRSGASGCGSMPPLFGSAIHCGYITTIGSHNLRWNRKNSSSKKVGKRFHSHTEMH